MPALPRHARRVAVVAVFVAVLLTASVTLRLLPVSASERVQTWPDGTVTYYDASGMTRTVNTAAAQWNSSGADVHFKEVGSARDADLVITTDDRKLRESCGRDCLGFTTTIGRPDEKPNHVLLGSALGSGARPLAVWVAAHEFGHVLGLRHHGGRACSLMSPRAFDTRCSPSVAVHSATPEDLACVPAPRDVEAAARLYGGHVLRVEPRCR
jgi:hypothetical protein